MDSRRNAARLSTVAALLLVPAFAWLALTGIWGFKRENGGFLGGGFDFDYLFHAGRLWLKAESPYQPNVIERLLPHGSSFAYPPVVAPLSMFLGAFPHDVAEVLMMVLNLLALGVMILGAVEYSQDSGGREPEQRRLLLAGTALLAVASPFVSHVLWMGQTTLIAAAFLTASIIAHRRGLPVLAGCLLACAMMKPQLVALIALWLLWMGPWRLRLAFVLALLALCLWPLIVSPPWELVREYLNSVAAYQGARFQKLEFAHIFGLQALVSAVGLPAPPFAPLGFVVLGLCLWKRRELQPSRVYTLLLLASLLFVFSHDYDLAALVLAIPVFWQLVSPKRTWILLGLFGLGLLYLPQRGFRDLGMPLLLRTRELALLGLAVALWLLAWRARVQRNSETTR